MKRKAMFLATVVFLLALLMSQAFAHFQLLIPSVQFVEGKPQKVELFMPFSHPMEGGPTMNMERPIEFGVFFNGKKIILNKELKEISLPVFKKWNPNYSKYKDRKSKGFSASYFVKRPGVYQFYIIPKPYFEPAEEKFIWQIAKTEISAFGFEEGWDETIGLKAEVIPLVKPFSIWVGNVFRGRVLINGKPAKGIEVEVEYFNSGDIKKLPSDAFVTQVVKTDDSGIFSYAIPWAGWWGFSALGDGGKKTYKGKEYPVELDAVIWVKAFPLPEGSRR